MKTFALCLGKYTTIYPMTFCSQSIPAIENASDRLAERSRDKEVLASLKSLLSNRDKNDWHVTQVYFAWIQAIKLFRSFEDEHKPSRTNEDFRGFVRALIEIGEAVKSLVASSDGFQNQAELIEEIAYALIPLVDTERHYYLADSPEKTRSLLDSIMAS